jgi:cysteinyl-tRNA synthetase
MNLQIYNTLTAKKEPFIPIEPGAAGLYVCGPTVYDYAHIGHVRCYVVFDVLTRFLREAGLKVRYVRNVTDIDDKIISRAAKTNEEPLALAKRFTEAFHEDMAAVGVLPADIEPRVSEHLPEIFALIGKLLEKGVAYQSGPDIYYSVREFAGYGKLSRRNLASLAIGASGRTSQEEADRKREASDFALWKGAKTGELSWQSPWGPGRPGWHIECSAMSMRYLGESFDLHGGGLDLIFPHHENEIAQSEAATGKLLARYWMHNGFIEVGKEKMSKSLGNFFTARECFRLVEPEALRYFTMTVHYRSPLNLDWTVDETGQVQGFPQIEEAERRIEYLYQTRKRLFTVPESRIDQRRVDVPKGLTEFRSRLTDALEDDLNMPAALAVTAEFLKQINELAEPTGKKKSRISQSAFEAAQQGFALLQRVLGLGTQNEVQLLERIRARRAKRRGIAQADVEQAIVERLAARKRKDFAVADQIRERLAEKGIELMDGPESTTWRIA